jgi:hypothetical protein
LSDLRDDLTGAPEAATTRVILIALITSCMISTAIAQFCESKAVSVEGKPLIGPSSGWLLRSEGAELSP